MKKLTVSGQARPSKLTHKVDSHSTNHKPSDNRLKEVDSDLQKEIRRVLAMFKVGPPEVAKKESPAIVQVKASSPAPKPLIPLLAKRKPLKKKSLSTSRSTSHKTKKVKKVKKEKSRSKTIKKKVKKASSKLKLKRRPSVPKLRIKLPPASTSNSPPTQIQPSNKPAAEIKDSQNKPLISKSIDQSRPRSLRTSSRTSRHPLIAKPIERKVTSHQRKRSVQKKPPVVEPPPPNLPPLQRHRNFPFLTFQPRADGKPNENVVYNLDWDAVAKQYYRASPGEELNNKVNELCKEAREYMAAAAIDAQLSDLKCVEDILSKESHCLKILLCQRKLARRKEAKARGERYGIAKFSFVPQEEENRNETLDDAAGMDQENLDTSHQVDTECNNRSILSSLDIQDYSLFLDTYKDQETFNLQEQMQEGVINHLLEDFLRNKTYIKQEQQSAEDPLPSLKLENLIPVNKDQARMFIDRQLFFGPNFLSLSDETESGLQDVEPCYNLQAEVYYINTIKNHKIEEIKKSLEITVQRQPQQPSLSALKLQSNLKTRELLFIKTLKKIRMGVLDVDYSPSELEQLQKDICQRPTNSQKSQQELTSTQGQPNDKSAAEDTCEQEQKQFIEVFCSVCFCSDLLDTSRYQCDTVPNPLIYCTGRCCMSFHKHCNQSHEPLRSREDPGGLKCEACQTASKTDVGKCKLCGGKGNFLFQGKKRYWHHVCCLALNSLLIPKKYVLFDSENIRIDPEYLKTNSSNGNACVLCNKRVGLVYKCCAEELVSTQGKPSPVEREDAVEMGKKVYDCSKMYFHPLCAYLVSFGLTVVWRLLGDL